jgi:hypothetical protein
VEGVKVKGALIFQEKSTASSPTLVKLKERLSCSLAAQ